MGMKMVAGAAALIAVLAGCSTTAETTSTTASPSAGDCPVSVDNAWVKATDTAMTGVFGDMKNSSGQDVTVVSASSPVAGMTELHETVDGVMKETESGFVVPASGQFELAPGGNHIMLMQLSQPIKAGDDVSITLNCSAGSTTFTAQAKTFDGAEESYMPTMPDMSSPAAMS